MEVQSESANAPQTDGQIRYLLIVARNESELFVHLARDFAKDGNVEVLLDRRRAERRRHHEARQPERRQAARRRQPNGRRGPLPSWLVIVQRQSG